MAEPPKPNFKSIAAKLRAELEIRNHNLKRKEAPETVLSPSRLSTHPSIKKVKIFATQPATPRSRQSSASRSSPVSIVSQNVLISGPFFKNSTIRACPVEVLGDTISIDSSVVSLTDSPASSSDGEPTKNARLSSEKAFPPRFIEPNLSNSYEDASSSQYEAEVVDYISLGETLGETQGDNKSTENQPWFRPESYPRTLSASERLNKEVESVVKYLLPTDQEIKLRKWIFLQVQKAAKVLWPSSTVHMFGSFSTRLFIPTSDVDIVVILPERTQVKLNSCLELLHSSIQNFVRFSFSKIRKNAKVPIINFVEQRTGLEVDVNINASSGLDSCLIITSFIRQCPAVSPLNMILKHFLELNDLNKVYTGGLSSYALTLLIVNFLQIHPFVRSGQIDPMKNLGLLLVEFLELYGVCFNSNHVGITLTNGGRYYKRSNFPNPLRYINGVSLELLDPQDESNNVASGSFNFDGVKTAFRKAYVSLSDATARYFSHDKDTSFPEPLLGQMLHIPSSTLKMREGLKSAFHRISTYQPSAFN